MRVPDGVRARLTAGKSRTGPGSGPHSGTDAAPATGLDQARVNGAVDRALAVPASTVERSVRRLRRRRPKATPQDVVAMFEHRFLREITAGGAAVGATAAVPGAGTGTAMAVIGGEAALALTEAVTLALRVAYVHGIDVRDPERRRALALSAILGDDATEVVREIVGRHTRGVTGLISDDLPTPVVALVNSALTKRLLTRLGTKSGLATAGKLAPFGIGAAIGAAGNRAAGRHIVRNCRAALGEPPAAWPPQDSSHNRITRS